VPDGRGLARYAAAITLLVSALAACDTDPENTAPLQGDSPNVLVIVTDDQPLNTMSAMPKTKRLLDRGGTRFVNAFATTPTCCPARASIMTGQYAHNHGVTRNSLAKRLAQTETLQSYLQGAGYFTALAGKYLNQWPIERDPPHFDRWAMYSSDDDNHRYYYGGRWNIDGRVEKREEYATRLIRRTALEYVNAGIESKGPWYVYVAPTAPHSDLQQLPEPEPRFESAPVVPWDPPLSTTEKDRSDKPGYVRSIRPGGRRGARARTAQLRSLRSVDLLVASLLSRIRHAGQDRDTLVVYLSDNGYMWGQHGLVTKHVPYSESVRIPFLFRPPAAFAGPPVDRRLVTNVDVAPTIMDAAGLSPDHVMDGRSLLRQGWGRSEVLLESWGSPALKMPRWAALRSRAAQFTEYYAGGEVTDSEYYDLRSDPLQLRNLLPKGRSEVDVRRWAGRLSRYSDCKGTSCP
jgi:arylsulfatase A-like enzyme